MHFERAQKLSRAGPKPLSPLPTWGLGLVQKFKYRAYLECDVGVFLLMNIYLRRYGCSIADVVVMISSHANKVVL